MTSLVDLGTDDEGVLRFFDAPPESSRHRALLRAALPRLNRRNFAWKEDGREGFCLCRLPTCNGEAAFWSWDVKVTGRLVPVKVRNTLRLFPELGPLPVCRKASLFDPMHALFAAFPRLRPESVGTRVGQVPQFAKRTAWPERFLRVEAFLSCPSTGLCVLAKGVLLLPEEVAHRFRSTGSAEISDATYVQWEGMEAGWWGKEG